MTMIAEVNRIGLCSTCNNASLCAHRKRRGFDAVFCDLFDDHVDSVVKGNGHGDVESMIALSRTSVNPSTSAKSKGLCQNCAHRETCTLFKPEEGIWHCEEYE
jgi:hypothetical protein